MDYLMGIVNYFFVPAIALWVYLALKGDDFKFSLINLIRYGVFTTLLVPLMHLCLLAPKILLQAEIIPYSSKYTFVAIILSVVLGVISHWITQYIKINVEEKSEKDQKVKNEEEQ